MGQAAARLGQGEAHGLERLDAPKPLWFKGLVALLTARGWSALIFYVLFLVSGVPAFLPDVIEEPAAELPGALIRRVR